MTLITLSLLATWQLGGAWQLCYLRSFWIASDSLACLIRGDASTSFVECDNLSQITHYRENATDVLLMHNFDVRMHFNLLGSCGSAIADRSRSFYFIFLTNVSRGANCRDSSYQRAAGQPDSFNVISTLLLSLTIHNNMTLLPSSQLDYSHLYHGQTIKSSTWVCVEPQSLQNKAPLHLLMRLIISSFDISKNEPLR